MIGGLGGTELIVIGILVIVLLFGAAKVPQLARSFGQAMGEFKKARREAELDFKKFGESVSVGEEEAISKTKAKSKAKTADLNIREVAAYLGIDTEAKTDEELEAEVKAKIDSSSKPKQD